MELNLYYISYTLHIDIDIVRQWPYEKAFKWMIALRKINEKMKEVQEEALSSAEISSAQSSGERVIVKNKQYS